MLKNKKLERQLLAAGIEIEESYGNDYGNDGQCTQCYFLKSGDCRFEMQNTFLKCKEVMNFKGNNWDGLYNRLMKDNQWEAKWRNIYFYTNKYYSSGGAILDVPDCELTPANQHIPIKYKPHQIWKFLDMVDAAKAKGGKQVVKFKGNEYEFEFPSVIIEECSEHTEDPLKELKPRKMVEQEAKEPAWKSVTGWDSVKDSCINGLLYYNSSDEKKPKVFEAKYRYPNYFATKKQAQQILALSQLTQIHKAMIDSSSTVDKEFGGVMFVGKDTLRLWTLDISKKGTEEGLCNFIEGKNKAFDYKPSCSPFEFEFYTREQADHFVKHNADLIDQYLGL